MRRVVLIVVTLAACARVPTRVMAPPTLAAPAKDVDELPRVVIAPQPVRPPPAPAPPAPPPAQAPTEPPKPPPVAPVVTAAPVATVPIDPMCDIGGDDDTFHTAHRGNLRWTTKPTLIRAGGSTTEWLTSNESFIACPGDFDVMRVDVPGGSEWNASMVVTWDPKEGDLVVEQLTPSGQVKPAAQFEPGQAVVSATFDEAARITAPARMNYRVRFQVSRSRD